MHCTAGTHTQAHSRLPQCTGTPPLAGAITTHVQLDQTGLKPLLDEGTCRGLLQCQHRTAAAARISNSDQLLRMPCSAARVSGTRCYRCTRHSQSHIEPGRHLPSHQGRSRVPQSAWGARSRAGCGRCPRAAAAGHTQQGGSCVRCCVGVWAPGLGMISLSCWPFAERSSMREVPLLPCPLRPRAVVQLPAARQLQHVTNNCAESWAAPHLLCTCSQRPSQAPCLTLGAHPPSAGSHDDALGGLP